MTASNDFENDLALLLANNTNIANIGDATGLRGSTAAGSFYIALHTADPGEAGKQDASECAYTGYARVAVARTGAGWTVSADTFDNTAAITFGEKTGGANETATHFSIGYQSAGTSKILVSNVLDASLLISNGIIPSFDPGELDVTIS